MKKEGSTASMLWLDIRRGFCSKRFWGIVGVVTIVFVVFLTLDIIYPLQKDVYKRQVYGIWKYFTVDDGRIDLSAHSYLYIVTLEGYQKIQRYLSLIHI